MLLFIVVLLFFLISIRVALWVLKPTRNVDRTMFSHWLKSLMRYYREGATLRIKDRGSPVELEAIMVRAEGDTCEFLIPVYRGPWSEQHVEEVQRVVQFDTNVSTNPLGLARPGETSVCIRTTVPDIWDRAAGDVTARVIRRMLDTFQVPPEARFKLTFEGQRSLERTKELHRRMKEGMTW